MKYAALQVLHIGNNSAIISAARDRQNEVFVKATLRLRRFPLKLQPYRLGKIITVADQWCKICMQ